MSPSGCGNDRSTSNNRQLPPAQLCETQADKASMRRPDAAHSFTPVSRPGPALRLSHLSPPICLPQVSSFWSGRSFPLEVVGSWTESLIFPQKQAARHHHPSHFLLPIETRLCGAGRGAACPADYPRQTRRQARAVWRFIISLTARPHRGSRKA